MNTNLKLYILFTGSEYWAVPELPANITGDFKMCSGYRWVKSRAAFSKRWQMFACPKNYQTLTPQEMTAKVKVDGILAQLP